MKLYKKRKAFTLVELIVVIAIMGIVFDIIYQTQNSNRNLFPKANAKSNIQQDVRLAASFISKDLRYARSVNILPDKPGTFSNNLVYIYSDGNNLVYRKNGTAKNIMLVENSRTVTLIFTHSTTGSFNDGKTVNFTIYGKTSEDFSLNSKVQILNLNKNVINGDNGFCISYSLTDFVNNPPIVSSSPLSVGGYPITHYNYDYVDSMDNSITISDSTLPDPSSIESFFIENDPGDFLTYSVSSDNPDVLSVSLDSSNYIHFSLNSTVTTDTPITIQVNAVDSYGGYASTKFLITVTSAATVSSNTITFNNLVGGKTYLKNSETKLIDLSTYFIYNPSANVSFTATKAATPIPVTNNIISIPTDTASSFSITVVGKIVGTTSEATGDISIIIKDSQIWFEDAGGNKISSGSPITLTNDDPYYLYIKTNDPSLIISCSPIPTKVDDPNNNFKITYDSSNKKYTLKPQNKNANITIDAYVQGYQNSEDAFKHISVTIKK